MIDWLTGRETSSSVGFFIFFIIKHGTKRASGFISLVKCPAKTLKTPN